MSITLRFTVLTILLVATVSGCSGDGSPVTLTAGHELTSKSTPTRPTHTQLWGYYDVYIDIENRTAEVVPNRQVMFAVNVARFINDPPSNLAIQILEIEHDSNYVDIDIDVTLTHPFPGLHKYDGYDVRGVFVGDASGTLAYNGSLTYPGLGTDQYMLDDPVNSDGGGPDGYTRWFNPTEFTTPGLFGYTPGAFQPPDFDGDATLCPYRYFADGLGAKQDLWEFLTATDDNGVFAAGETNTRNYYLRFPYTKEMEFGYAIVADWGGPTVHPSNAAEAVTCSVIDNSDVYYPYSAGGNGDLILDISLFGWEYQPLTIYIESTVLSAVANFDPGAIATGGGDHYSTYHVEIPANKVTTAKGNEYWVIAEYEAFDYSNPLGVPNLAESDHLAAFFRYDLTIEYTGKLGWARTWGGESWDYGCGVVVDGSGNVYVTGVFCGQVDFDPDGGDSYTSNGYGDAFLSKYDSWGNFEWARIWGGSGWDYGDGVAVDGLGNIYVAGSFWATVDFDPDGGIDEYTSNGYSDVFLSKFDSSGNFDWVRTWGGLDQDSGEGVVVDGSGNLYVTGLFEDTADFDPGPGTDEHTSNGDYDAFLSKFDLSGNFKWARTWGGSSNDFGNGVAVDGSGNVYVTGNFKSTVDFDPGGGDPHTWNGGRDIFLSKFDSSGNFKWARTWGGPEEDYGNEVAVDNSGNVYVTGFFESTLDFDPDGGNPHTSNGSSDVFLSKFDSSGNFKGTRTWGGTWGDGGCGVAADSSGNVYVTGGFCGTVDFEPGGGDVHTSNGYQDVFLSKFDSSGNFEWARTWGGSDFDYGHRVAADGSGNVYVTGLFEENTVDFAPTDPPCNDDPDEHNSNGSPDAFLTKHLPNGCWSW